jgi:hypothetical protein
MLGANICQHYLILVNIAVTHLAQHVAQEENSAHLAALLNSITPEELLDLLTAEVNPQKRYKFIIMAK